MMKVYKYPELSSATSTADESQSWLKAPEIYLLSS
jgi:hypothetical protein